MSKAKIQTLIETIELTQNLAVYYISLMKEVDPKKVFSSEGKDLNSLYWLVGHLAWAENMLVLQGTQGKGAVIPWLDSFKLGEPHQIDENISFGELKAGAKELHKAALAHLNTLSDEDLLKPNTIGFGFGQEPTNQVVLMHFIRHLGMHIGHLSWLCKLHGVKSV